MQTENQSRTLLIIGVVVVFGLGILTFLMITSSGTQSSLPATEAADGDQAVVEPTIQQETTAAPAEEQVEPTAQEAPESQEIQPTARVGLQGTDPGIVNLASGDIQLVEFFAFW